MPTDMHPDKPGKRLRLLVLVVVDDAKTPVIDLLRSIAATDDFDLQVLLIDDHFRERSAEVAERLGRPGEFCFPVTVLTPPCPQGYGGSQKLGYQFALDQGFDLVVPVHGGGRFTPEILPRLLAPILQDRADVVLGSPAGAAALRELAGERPLAWCLNRILRSRLGRFRTPHKAFTAAALRQIPFELNSNRPHFDTEVIIQLLRAKCRIAEVSVPAGSGGEVPQRNGVRHAKDAIVAAMAARLQDYGLVYRRNFDVGSPDDERYRSKLDFASTHSEAVREVEPGSVVIDAGCGPGHVGPVLRARGCRYIGIDRLSPPDPTRFDEFFRMDLDGDSWPRPLADVDTVLLLDIIEHLRSPEEFCQRLRAHAQDNPDIKIVISTGNIGFFVTRLMLFLGQFNYSRRGILDETHTRLFTFSSLGRLLKESGFTVERIKGIPAPVPLVVKGARKQKLLMAAQRILGRISRNLFAYQMLIVARPLPFWRACRGKPGVGPPAISKP